MEPTRFLGTIEMKMRHIVAYEVGLWLEKNTIPRLKQLKLSKMAN